MAFAIKRSLGISLKDEMASFVELSRVAGRVRVIASGSLPLPQAPISLSEGAGEPSEGLPARLLRPKPDAVVVGLSRGDAILRPVDLPSLEDKDLAGLLAYEIEKHLPFPVDEACYDFQRVRKNGGTATVMLVATRRAVMERHLEAAGRLKLQPTSVGVSSLAALNAIVHRLRPAPAELLCLVSVGSRHAEMSAARGGSLVFSRVLPFADGRLDPLQGELRRVLDEAGATPARIFVTGGSAELCLRLSQALEVPVEPWNPAEPEVDASAFGLALQGLVKLPIRIDLLPPDRRPKRRERALVVLFALLALLAALGAAWGAGTAYRERRALSQLTQQLAEVQTHAAAVARLKTEFTKLRTQVQVFEGLAQERTRGLTALKELVSLLPASVYLTDFTLEGAKLQIRGTTGGSASELIAAFERSTYFENASFISPISAQGTDRQGFQLQAAIKGR
jgi:Tfp pilus assembly protein PilN